jgi:hypothetical protein
MAVAEKADLVASWHSLFRKGTDFDSWGQVVEAVDEYSLYASRKMISGVLIALFHVKSYYLRLIRGIKEELHSEQHNFSKQENTTLENIVTCLRARRKALQNQLEDDGMTLEQLKTLSPGIVLKWALQIYSFLLHVQVQIH